MARCAVGARMLWVGKFSPRTSIILKQVQGDDMVLVR
jgi:hypothetical protein